MTSSVVRTPAGPIPLPGSRWTVTDQWVTERRTPKWAVVLAIAGLCVTLSLSLLLLRVRRPVARGVILVGVSNGPHRYVARIPITHPGQARTIYHQVNYVRSLAAL